MKPNEFKCAVCKEVFTKGWTGEEAAAELKVNIPGIAEEECELVCDDCYIALGFEPVAVYKEP